MSWKPVPLATSTQLSPLAKQLVAAQGMLQAVPSQKQAKDSLSSPILKKRMKPAVKQPKLKTTPKADTTLSSQVLDRFKKVRSSSTQEKVNLVTKTETPLSKERNETLTTCQEQASLQPRSGKIDPLKRRTHQSTKKCKHISDSHSLTV
ncbi:hypothetical protein QAD02_014243 [Eretmocerus hayati]|uniref:Uncharacterized protein n=1 Tax=Eretmocerus hayati TaxID=131215 RepID=A0ACC2P4T0_9HYME|nr:hypothetical protein QAD02_014243 [Eretmocerus hayati]